jgi:cytochrome b pre-mRNA-processing protein 3
LNGAGMDQALPLAAYAQATEADLGLAGEPALLLGSFKFRAPIRKDVTP